MYEKLPTIRSETGGSPERHFWAMTRSTGCEPTWLSPRRGSFYKLFTPCLTLRKLRPRFFNYNVWQWVLGGAPLSYASEIYRHSVI